MAIYPLAVTRPGPQPKTGYPGVDRNDARGVVCHSMAGALTGALAELDRPQRRASWHFSVATDGRVLQHYDTLTIAWHCGSRPWNSKLIGIEHEGGYDHVDEPLTREQLAASVALVRWLAAEHGFPLIRGQGLREHNEVAPPDDPTGCPNGRIPWDRYTEARMYSDKEIDAKVAALLANEIRQQNDLQRLGTGMRDLQVDLVNAIIDHNRRLAALEKLLASVAG